MNLAKGASIRDRGYGIVGAEAAIEEHDAKAYDAKTQEPWYPPTDLIYTEAKEVVSVYPRC